MYGHNNPDAVYRISRTLDDVRRTIRGEGTGNAPLTPDDRDPDGRTLRAVLAEFSGEISTFLATSRAVTIEGSDQPFDPTGP
jgi:hypothetical protein